MSSSLSLKREREEPIEDNITVTIPTYTTHHELHITPSIELQQHTPVASGSHSPLIDHNISTFKHEATPARSDTSSLSDLSSLAPKHDSPASAFALLNGTVPAPAKRPKLTFAEREAQNIMKEIKAQEKAQEKAEQLAKREAEASQKKFEKARRELEREEERRKKDAELQEKKAAKALKDAEKEKVKAAKEEEKRKKDEEKQRLEDEKQKKERTQPKLLSFFSAPKPKTSADETPCTIQKSASMDILSKETPNSTVNEYEKVFPPFFLKEHVTLAPYNQFQRERWGSQNLEEDLDNYISNASERPYTLELDPSSLFNCPDLTLHVRGKEITPVRQIMDAALGRTGKPADSTTDSQNTQIKRTKKLLQSIPYKIISFSQDVRPPYCGTRTRHGLATLQKLARHPCKPELEDLNYDYDSEAEWIENDEDEGGAEDLMSNGSDDEDDDDEGDGDEFIDDADADNVRRAMLPADQEPRSTGLCWEDGCRKGPNLELDSYRMEVMNENIDSTTSIDPFSTSYWTTSSPKSGMDPPRVPLRAMQNNTPVAVRSDIASLLSGKSSSQTKILGSTNSTPTSATKSNNSSLVLITDKGDIEKFRNIVENSTLTKIGLIEIIHQAMKEKSSTKKAVKASLETWAVRHGGNKQGAIWGIKADVYPL